MKIEEPAYIPKETPSKDDRDKIKKVEKPFKGNLFDKYALKKLENI